ncbi:HNH endonuclease signature motif containing protein [Halobacillus sp. HZG1]|uniref:HNH endonuclease n=1 Tax=Halobacillus sp. HZG1 TaxID=3111769 RepID=UPI002DB890F5|nr:HNH endonuclease signature motif containing protein [Halobacillus sp. HZG1]MEC3884598.1 HNH endonuclease signature motif containing protein [Halobacillus sp. HZG1]
MIQLSPGDVIDNKELTDIFKCSPQGGMRRGKRTNTLVIVSNHVKSLYGDRWEGDVLHYIGMGMNGQQSFDYMQNKTLFHSQSNGVEVHLFEVFKEKEYTYQGQVQLIEEPYVKQEPDEGGQLRNVCVFPVGQVSNHGIKVEEGTLEELEEKARSKASKLSKNELYERAKASEGRPGYRESKTTHHQRNPYVIEYAKKWADGICQLCEQPAPFFSKDGSPYLETHHIEWLARGGKDTVENTVALCPNCHKKMHILDASVDVITLKEKVTGNV